MHLIIFLQSVIIQFCRIFWHMLYDKVRKKFLLQSVAEFYYKCVRLVSQIVKVCYYKVHLVLQSVTDFIAKCIRHYIVWQLLQSET